MSGRSIAMTLGWGCCLAILAGSLWAADDWPGWRGPKRDGSVAGFVAPKVWPKDLKRQWKVEVGEGYASPVAVADRVFVLSRQGENEVVRAVQLADGRELWSQNYPAPYEVNRAAARHGKGPKSTPVAADGRLVTLGISGILSCWDAAGGKMLWQHEFSKQFKNTSPLYGTAMSPLVAQGLVIAHVGGHDQGALTAFDPQTGQTKWAWTGDGPGYASPIVATLAGAPQVITQSQGACIGVSPADGSLLWTMPYLTEYEQNIVTPLLAGDLLIISGVEKGTSAYRLQKTGSQWSPQQVWHNPDVSMYLNSPVAVGQRIFGLVQEKKGQFFCLDAATGKTLWTSDGRMGDNAAILTAGEILLALTTGGELIAFKAGADRFEPLARYKVADTPTYAHPVVLGKLILIKDASSLALWTLEQ